MQALSPSGRRPGPVVDECFLHRAILGGGVRFLNGRRGCRVQCWKSLKDIYHLAAVDHLRPASELQAGVASSRTACPWAKDSWISVLFVPLARNVVLG